MYWALFICLLTATVFAYAENRDDRWLYALPFLLLSLALCLRFGQGTDYPNYQFLYDHPGHGEWGYSWLTQTCRRLGFSFPQFIILFSLPMCAFTHRALMKYSYCRPLSLFLLYPTIYLTYYFSGIRQGFVIAAFLGVLLPLLEQKKTLLYISFCIFLTAIHSVALALIPLVIIVRFSIRHLLALAGIGLIFGVINLVYPFGLSIINSLADTFSIEREFEQSSVYWLAFAERVVMCAFVVIIHSCENNPKELRRPVRLEADGLFLKVYLFGFFVFMLLSANAMLSSRFCIVFKCVEVLLISSIVHKRLRMRHAAMAMLAAFCLLMTWKNINSFIKQGQYAPGIDAINYPYVSIFHPSDIRKYRKYPAELL